MYLLYQYRTQRLFQSQMVGQIFLNWNTIEREILRYKIIFTSRGIPEFTQNKLNW